MGVVKKSRESPLTGYGMLWFSLKLKRLKHTLRNWNKVHFGNVHQNFKLAELDLRTKELSYEQSGLERDLLSLQHAQSLYIRSLAEEEAFWK